MFQMKNIVNIMEMHQDGLGKILQRKKIIFLTFGC